MNTSLEDYFPTQASLSSDGIVLQIQNLGPVPSFKNHKSIFRNKRTGKSFIASDPKKKKWMESVIQSFVYQLSGLFPTKDRETHGECQKRLLTASSLPLDDSLAWMIPGRQGVKKVNKGEEGSIIIIQKINYAYRK